MATATLTPTAIATATDDAIVANRESIELFRNAIATVNDTVGVSASAVDTLKAIALERYTRHATRFQEERNGKTVITSDMKKAVTVRVWQDAGYPETPSVAERAPFPALKSLANYISEFHRVATSLEFGTAELETLETVADAVEAIRESAKDLKEKEGKVMADKSARAFSAFLSASPKATKDAFALVIKTLSHNQEHLPAFIAELTAIPPVDPADCI